MAFWNSPSKTVESPSLPPIPKYVPSIFAPSNILSKINEQANFQGKVEQFKVKFPVDLGEQHPFNFAVTEGLYKEFGLVQGIVDKYIDFVIGPGFFVESDDERAKKIIEDFMQDTNFDSLLRSWLKEALVKGTGFLELGGGKDEVPQGMKILDAKTMWIQRDEVGEITGYNQFVGKLQSFATKEKIPVEPFQIAHLAINKIGSMEYGMGIVASSLTTINSFIGNRKELQLMVRRKANSPYHVKIGDKDHLPHPTDIQAFGEKLAWLNNQHEWCTDALVDIKVVDFGDVGEKFKFVLENDMDLMFMAFQVPAVLLGRPVNLATAPVQLEAFERRIQSIQMETEKVIENDIFNRVLKANGLDIHVEFQWGQPSKTESNERVTRLTEILKLPTLSMEMATMVEMDLAKTLGYDETELEDAQEERRREEEEIKQPRVPGSNEEMVEPFVYKEIQEIAKNVVTETKCSCSVCEAERKPTTIQTLIFNKKVFTRSRAVAWANSHNFKSDSVDTTEGSYRLRQKPPSDFKSGSFRTINITRGVESVIGKLKEGKEDFENIDFDYKADHSLVEWLGFDYQLYKKSINQYLTEYDFDNLLAHNAIELEAGRLTKAQIAKLRIVMKTGFQQGQTIQQIADGIRSEVKPKTLYRIGDDGSIVLKQDGERALALSKQHRPIMFARTETTRAASEGALRFYKEKGVEKVRFVASIGERTCPECNSLHGNIFTMNEADGMIPVHSMCRCVFVVVTE